MHLERNQSWCAPVSSVLSRRPLAGASTFAVRFRINVKLVSLCAERPEWALQPSCRLLPVRSSHRQSQMFSNVRQCSAMFNKGHQGTQIGEPQKRFPLDQFSYHHRLFGCDVAHSDGGEWDNSRFIHRGVVPRPPARDYPCGMLRGRGVGNQCGSNPTGRGFRPLRPGLRSAPSGAPPASESPRNGPDQEQN